MKEVRAEYKENLVQRQHDAPNIFLGRHPIFWSVKKSRNYEVFKNMERHDDAPNLNLGRQQLK